MVSAGRARPTHVSRADLIFIVTFFINPSRKNREKKSKQLPAQNCKGFANKILNPIKLKV